MLPVLAGPPVPRAPTWPRHQCRAKHGDRTVAGQAHVQPQAGAARQVVGHAQERGDAELAVHELRAARPLARLPCIAFLLFVLLKASQPSCIRLITDAHRCHAALCSLAAQ
jgi:hypothetical protein